MPLSTNLTLGIGSTLCVDLSYIQGSSVPWYGIFTPRLSDVQVPPQERLNGGGGEGVSSATGTSG